MIQDDHWSVPDSLDKSPYLVIVSFSSRYLNDYYVDGRDKWYIYKNTNCFITVFENLFVI